MIFKPLHLIYVIFAVVFLVFISHWHEDKLNDMGILGLWENVPLQIDQTLSDIQSGFTYLEFTTGQQSDDLEGTFLIIKSGSEYSGKFIIDKDLDQIKFLFENDETSIPFKMIEKSELRLKINESDTIFPYILKKLN